MLGVRIIIREITVIESAPQIVYQLTCPTHGHWVSPCLFSVESPLFWWESILYYSLGPPACLPHRNVSSLSLFFFWLLWCPFLCVLFCFQSFSLLLLVLLVGLNIGASWVLCPGLWSMSLLPERSNFPERNWTWSLQFAEWMLIDLEEPRMKETETSTSDVCASETYTETTITSEG